MQKYGKRDVSNKLSSAESDEVYNSNNLANTEFQLFLK